MKNNTSVYYIKDFQQLNIEIELNKNDEITSEYLVSEKFMKQFKIDENKNFTARFPLIIKSDGTVCQYALLYLNNYLETHNDISGAGLKSEVYDLINYYNFIENNSLGLFFFPKNKNERVTNKYNRYLYDECIKGNCELSLIKKRMNTIIKFYEFIKISGFFDKSLFEYPPYRVKNGIYQYINETGNIVNKEYRSTDISIKSPKKIKRIEYIYDGSALRPLLKEEQKIISDYIGKYAARSIQLICAIAFYTGARLQTICTIRKEDIKKLLRKPLNNKVNYNLAVGIGTHIDTKRSQNYVLEVPKWLVIDLDKYIESEEWVQRAKKSYYGVSDSNYIFLTKFGSPFYTSRKEIIDRKNDIKLYTDKIKYKIYSGSAVRTALKNVVDIIKKENVNFENFRFHDFRATFGMNLLEDLIDGGLSVSQTLNIIKNRMGHRSILTTENYLNYRSLLDRYNNIQCKLEIELLKYK